MRMWMINPRLLCDRHLIKEHEDVHRIVGVVKYQSTLQRPVYFGEVVEPQSVYRRHQELADEIHRRGMGHNTPLPKEVKMPQGASINKRDAAVDLQHRCSDCADRLLEEWMEWEGHKELDDIIK